MRTVHSKHLSYFLFTFLTAVIFLGSGLFVSAAPAPKAPDPAIQQQQDKDAVLRQLLPAKQTMVPGLITQDTLRITPYLEYYLDTESTDISEISSPQTQEKFLLFSPDRLEKTATGTLWLRFVLPAAQPKADTLGSTAEASDSSRLVLDLGASVPGSPVLYTPAVTAEGQLEWRETHPQGSTLLLPEAAAGVPLTCFLRIDGVPGTWFSPVVQTAESIVAAGGTWQSANWHLIGLGTLAALFLVCLFKGLVEPEQWRIWALLYIACAAAQSWAGLPSPEGLYTAKTIAALCCGGLAIMLWPLAGRSMMRSSENSRLLDVSLTLLCLVGAAMTVLPLVPQLKWVCRFTELWPIALVIFIPSALWGCAVGAPNSFKFLLGTSIPPLATALAVLGIRSNFAPETLACVPLLGVALGAIITISLAQPAIRRNDLSLTQGLPAPVQGNSGAMPSADPMLLDLKTEQAVQQPVELGEPIQPEGRDSGKDSLFADCLAPLQNLEKKLGSCSASLPASCRKALDSLIDKTKELVIELQDLEQQSAREKEEASFLQVVVISKDPSFGAILGHVLRKENCHIRQTASLDGALEMAGNLPAGMYIFQGEFADVQVSPYIAKLRTIKARFESGWVDPVFLAYTQDESTWRPLAKAGFTHALVLPIDDVAIVNTIKELKEENAAALAKQPAAKPAPQKESIPDIFGNDARAAAPSFNNMGTEPLNLAKTTPPSGNAMAQGPLDLGAPISMPQNRRTAQPAATGPLEMDTLEFVSPFPTAGTSMMISMDDNVQPQSQPQPEKLSPALQQECVRSLALMKHAFSNGNMPALAEIAGQTAASTEGCPAISKLCMLLKKAAVSANPAVVPDLIRELSEAVERRSSNQAGQIL